VTSMPRHRCRRRAFHGSSGAPTKIEGLVVTHSVKDVAAGRDCGNCCDAPRSCDVKPMEYADRRIHLGPSIVAPGQRGVLARTAHSAGDIVLSERAFVVGWPNMPDLHNPNDLLDDPAVPDHAADAFYTHCAENGLSAAVGVAHCFLKLQRAWQTDGAHGFDKVFDQFKQFRCCRRDVIDADRARALELLRPCYVHAPEMPRFGFLLTEDAWSQWLGMWNLYNQTGGLFFIESHFNHSCRPQVKAKHGKFPLIEMKAVRPISSGEEILTTYVNPAASRKERQEELCKYGFECRCPRCEKDVALNKLPKEEVMRLMF